MSTPPTIDVVIPSYNGQKLLEENLPLLFKFASNQISKVIIVDDGSTDSTKSFLNQKYKNVVYIKNNANLGFSKSVNIGVSASSADYVVLLNNDVKVKKDFLKEPLKIMERDKNLFAVNFNESNSSWPLVSWSKGKMQFTRSNKKDKAYYCAWASGGSSLIRKNFYEQIGGLNEIFSPAYWEDIDLGWRAWKNGWAIIWTPNSNVDHDHESTTSRLDKQYLSNLKQVNELVFTWLNFSELTYKVDHLLNIFFYALTHPGYFKIIFAAYKKYASAKKYNQGNISSSSIFSKINKVYGL